MVYTRTCEVGTTLTPVWVLELSVFGKRFGKCTTFDNLRKVSVMSVTVEFDAEVGCKHTDHEQTGWCSCNTVGVCSGGVLYTLP